MQAKAFRQVRVSEEWHAKRYGVGFASLQNLVGRLESKLFIGDVTAAESRFQFRTNPLVAKVFAGADKGDASLAQFASDVTEGGQWIGVTHVMGIAARGQVHSNVVIAPNGDDRIRDFKHEPGAIFDRTAIIVGAVIGFVLKKL